MNYKFLTATTVKQIEDDGIGQTSCSVDHAPFVEWLAAGNTPEPADQPAPVNPLDLAEAHIASHFSTARLLQMKDWRDTFPEEDAPMLEAVYDWVNAITIQAAQGQTDFAAPPHTFEELLAEAMQFLGIPAEPAPVTEPDPAPVTEPVPEPEPTEDS